MAVAQCHRSFQSPRSPSPQGFYFVSFLILFCSLFTCTTPRPRLSVWAHLKNVVVRFSFRSVAPSPTDQDKVETPNKNGQGQKETDIVGYNNGRPTSGEREVSNGWRGDNKTIRHGSQNVLKLNQKKNGILLKIKNRLRATCIFCVKC